MFWILQALKILLLNFGVYGKIDQLMGMGGALKFLDKDHGEFKSIRVNDKFRKKGNGIKVINHLINEAKKLNIKKLSLETGAGDIFFTQLESYF